MILEELRLHNFCLYRGDHAFNLRPSRGAAGACPIVLFGGMNGAGKTTVLDAVQLALYGSRARCANRIGKSYEEYLRECVHRGIDLGDGASVAISFRYIADGAEHRYEVTRDWSVRDKSVREHVRVIKDNNPDQLLSENWNDFVEELIPLGISQLFFFDAEKIRFLADDETDTAALGVAIKSLLGLDLAERLIADAAIVERRLSESILSHKNDDKLQELERTHRAKCAEIADAMAERGVLQNRFDRAKLQRDKAKAEFAAAGGEHWIRRTEIDRQLDGQGAAVAEVETELRALSAGELPLTLVPDLLQCVAQQDANEQDEARAGALQQMLAARDKKVIKDLRDAGQSATTIQAIRKVLDDDRQQRAKPEEVARRLDLSGQARQLLTRLVNGNLSETCERTESLIRRLEGVQADREKFLRLRNAIPQDQDIAKLVERLETAAAAFGKLDGDLTRLNTRLDVLRRERDDLDNSLSGMRSELIDSEISNEESLRLVGLAQKTQHTMRDFLRRATTHKIDRLSGLVTESFRYLLRKQTLVQRVQIDPESFRIDLVDESGRLLPKSRLSEGEKQIFAIAVLWGLAQAAPRPLPAIIDTPMARLDSEHRQHLVERYFPNASHQVIILSTDTEIEQGYFEHLRTRISRAYHLRYDDSQRCTLPEAGYFWAPADTEAAEAGG